MLDLSTLLPGPLATLLLAEAGAEVVKIEPPGRGEEMRGHAPRWGHDSASFALLNRGKRSVALDLKDPAERNRLHSLVKRADVIVEPMDVPTVGRFEVIRDPQGACLNVITYMQG